jgi:hypothetical protein
MQPWLNKKDCKLSKMMNWTHLTTTNRNLLILRDGKQVSDLRLDIRYLPILKPSKRADGTIVPAAESSNVKLF